MAQAAVSGPKKGYHMDKNEIFEALGVEPEAGDHGGNEQEAAAPAAQEENLDSSEPPENAGNQGDDQPEDKPDENPEDQPESEAQSEEERRENAARRRLEQHEAVDKAVREAEERLRESFRQEREQFYQSAGLRNTFTGEAITSDEQFRAWKSAFDRQRIEEDLGQGKLTPEAIDQAVSNSPAMVRLNEINEKMEAERREAEARQKREAEEAFQAKVAEEIAEIHKMNPSVNGVEDLLKLPNADKFQEYVRRGNTFLDAYYLANREEVQRRSAANALRQAQAQAKSKAHLPTAPTPRGAGAESVPKEDMALFRLFNPDATEDEIQAYYNKQQS